MAGRNGRSPRDPVDLFSSFMGQTSRRAFRLGPIVLILAILLALTSSFYQVEAGEIAVIRTLGRESGRADPGLHFRIPLAQKVDIVNVSRIRRIEVGFRGDQPKPTEALMLTGDENMVEAHMIVQYRVSEPSKYLFRLAAPEDALRSSAEVALRGIIGQTTIDDAITKGRGLVQEDTRALLQKLMDDYQSGITITEVKLQSVDPPAQVRDAFHEVVRAREKKEELINQARGYQEDVIPRARGEAEKQMREAEAFREERVLKAQGDARRFDAVYAEYKKAEGVTRKRLSIETLEQVLTRVQKKTIIDGSLSGSTLPFLPIGGNRRPATLEQSGDAQ
ncbi:MAG: HflK protein [Sorangiineae bacterium NIC37A_2]|nr:MAG: HflK protein [Sorangiineae bacterium NIC37A_2]